MLHESLARYANRYGDFVLVSVPVDRASLREAARYYERF